MIKSEEQWPLAVWREVLVVQHLKCTDPLEETPRNEIYQKVEKSTQEIQSDSKHHTILLAE